MHETVAPTLSIFSTAVLEILFVHFTSHKAPPKKSTSIHRCKTIARVTGFRSHLPFQRRKILFLVIFIRVVVFLHSRNCVKFVTMADQADTKFEPLVDFHFFPLLPLELRRKIYILATPSRVVHVQEFSPEDKCEDGDEVKVGLKVKDDSGYKAFVERCRTTPIQLKLHPDIAYFAHNWEQDIRPDLEWFPNDGTLEFTSTRKHQPWPPTDETPEIPIAWLADNPFYAWHMTRDAYLRSSAPIPPFLHVCSESREVLMRYGYELAFGTRTHGPHTWFNFEQDTLYISCGPYGDAAPLSGDHWDVGLFRPTDLLWLLPSVQELFFVEWEPELISNWINFHFSNQYPTLSPGKINMDAGLENRYVCVPIDEIDVVTPYTPGGIHSNQYKSSDLKRHRNEDLCSHFFDAVGDFTKEVIGEYLKEMTADTADTSEPLGGPRKVPTVTLVHLCSPQMARYIFDMRKHFWHQLLAVADFHESHPEIKLDFVIPAAEAQYWVDEEGGSLWPPQYDII